MKTTLDNKTIPSRVWYYLLEWKDVDNNLDYVVKKFGKASLAQFTYEELHQLFNYAVSTEFKQS
jgi:hypothetical protein